MRFTNKFEFQRSIVVEYEIEFFIGLPVTSTRHSVRCIVFHRFSRLIENLFDSFRKAVVDWKIEQNFIGSAHRLQLNLYAPLEIASAFTSHQTHATSLQLQQKWPAKNQFSVNSACRVDELVWFESLSLHSHRFYHFAIELTGCCWLLHALNERKLENVLADQIAKWNEGIYRSEKQKHSAFGIWQLRKEVKGGINGTHSIPIVFNGIRCELNGK